MAVQKKHVYIHNVEAERKRAEEARKKADAARKKAQSDRDRKKARDTATRVSHVTPDCPSTCNRPFIKMLTLFVSLFTCIPSFLPSLLFVCAIGKPS